MKKQVFLAKIAGFALVCALLLTACDDGNSPAAHNHEWGNWTVTRTATCTTEGVKTRVCLLNATHEETEPIAIVPTAHDWQPAPSATVPTCTEDGSGDQICAYNAAHTKSGIIPKLGHDYQNYAQSTAPTCTTEGSETGTCTRDATHTDTRSVAALGHDYQWATTTPATCTTAGVETGTCTRDAVTTTRAGAAAFGHDYEWKVTTPPTITAGGIETETCKHNPLHTNNTRTIPKIFTSSTELISYFNTLSDNDADTPYTVAMNISDLTDIKTAIMDSGKFVNLDLSGSNLTSIGNSAFSDCYRLTSIIIPDSVTSIEDAVFSNCFALASINLPEGLTSIGTNAFASAGVVSFTIPSSVTNIGMGALHASYGIKEINVDPNNAFYSSVDGVLYNKDKTTLIQYPARKEGSTVTISGDITNIDYQAFTLSINLTAINVDSSNSVYSSVDGVLYNKDITTLIQCPTGRKDTLIIPNSVTSIRGMSFMWGYITSVTIPNSVTSIEWAFAYCTSLISVTFEGTIAEDNFTEGAFQSSDLREKYLSGGPGTYTTENPGWNSIWEKQQ
ncbi:MAG: leucine-rich repeat domain-containing protein [Treponema sp.]|nr:leucine-rich repeat domain-containing protein [Treponema sp.]